MDDTPETGAGVAAPRKRGRGVLWAFIAVVLAFGAGFGWQFYEADQVRAQLSETRQELMIERLRGRLGQATIAAHTGDYESARQGMSGFFTRLDEVALTLPDPAAQIADEFLAMRDEVITGLSRADPEFAGVLYGMLEQFRSATGLQEQMGPGRTPPAAEPAAQPDTEMQGDTRPLPETGTGEAGG